MADKIESFWLKGLAEKESLQRMQRLFQECQDVDRRRHGSSKFQFPCERGLPKPSKPEAVLRWNRRFLTVCIRDFQVWKSRKEVKREKERGKP